jgi:hypothetical protein
MRLSAAALAEGPPQQLCSSLPEDVDAAPSALLPAEFITVGAGLQQLMAAVRAGRFQVRRTDGCTDGHIDRRRDR